MDDQYDGLVIEVETMRRAQAVRKRYEALRDAAARRSERRVYQREPAGLVDVEAMDLAIAEAITQALLDAGLEPGKLLEPTALRTGWVVLGKGTTMASGVPEAVDLYLTVEAGVRKWSFVADEVTYFAREQDARRAVLGLEDAHEIVERALVLP